jgi:hypothetical protein
MQPASIETNTCDSKQKTALATRVAKAVGQFDFA